MAITANQSVLTLDYWKAARHLQVGDWVFDKDGKPTRITLVQQYYAEECYEVLFTDHLTVSGDKRLSFQVENEVYRKKIQDYQNIRKFRRPLKFLSIEALLELNLIGRKRGHEYSLPTTKPLEFPAQTLGIPPFVFGFWFLNRRPKGKYSARTDFVISKFKAAGYKIETIEPQHFKTTPVIEHQLAPNIPNKIPTNYLMASVEERIELLSGLVNSKKSQYNVKTDWFRITSVSLRPMQQIQGLVESLGCKSQIKYDDTQEYYTLFFKCKHKLIPNQESKPAKVHLARRYIKEIKQIAPQMVVHIETEGENNSILVAEGFIATC